IKMWCSVGSFEQQAGLSRCVMPHEVCYVRVQIDLPLSSTGLEVLHNPRTILFDLLLHLDGATAVDEVPSLNSKALRDSHSCGCKQDVQGLLLPGSRSDEFRDGLRLQRRTLLLRVFDDG